MEGTQLSLAKLAKASTGISTQQNFMVAASRQGIFRVDLMANTTGAQDGTTTATPS
jgi:hypothetical protein